MRIDVVTIFPELIEAHAAVGLLGKGIQEGALSVTAHDLRERGRGKHRSVDDEPYGGGPGMVMRPEPIFEVVEPLLGESSHVVLMSARGKRFTHADVARLVALDHLVLICGRYEGVDQRVADHLADEELSIGDFVLHGGEVAAMTIIEAVSRYVPGVLGNPASLESESHVAGILEYPQYTRPAEFRGWRVPDVLLSGHHAEIETWRRDMALQATQDRPEPA